MHELASEFKSALSRVEIPTERRRFASEAQSEIRSYLEADETLCGWGVDTILIGSYRRETGIFPGKDVDVFTKLEKLRAENTDPTTIFDATWAILADRYDDRAEPQHRSVKVSFDRDGFEFSVDVVPAVRYGDRWAIPRHDTALWGDVDQRWVETDPEKLTMLTTEMNKRPTVRDQGAYVPTVKLVRQTRRHHRRDAKPGGFYFELMTYWAFANGEVQGTSFAQIFATTLRSIHRQLASGADLVDPVLGTAYKPTPEADDRVQATATFSQLADQAEEAINAASRCRAGALWRSIFGRNEQGWCFPVPSGCDEHGNALPVTSVGVLRGSREAGGFA